jgi:eukaryotic-like serine/threonine-protein kinase
VVIYQMITGRAPFAGESYAELVLKVGLEQPEPIVIALPMGLPEIILRCLEKDPALRPQNVGELARMIAPYATDTISSAQAAGRVGRILQQRSMQMGGMPGSPFAGGLSAPIPISPAQMTPRSWPPSQATSLSQSVGQVTVHSRGSHGWMIAGILGLCVVAGVGGYAVSQMSKTDNRAEPASAAAPAAASPAPEVPVTVKPAPVAPPPPPVAPPAAVVKSAPPAEPPAPPGHPAPPASATVTEPPTTWKPTTPSPTIVEHPAEAKPAAPTAPDTRPAAVAKPAEPKHDSASDAKAPTAKPGSKPAKPKKPADDLFDSRH